jgi:predicted XRE-type DNA-binding protein
MLSITIRPCEPKSPPRHFGEYKVKCLEIDDKVIALYDQGLSGRKIARSLGVSDTPVKRILRINFPEFGKKKTVSRFEAEAAWIGGCFIHPNSRVARHCYMLRHGVKLLPEEFVCHTCDTPTCILDAHHFLGDALINTRDMMCKGRFRGGVRKGVIVSKEKALEIRASFLSQRELAKIYGVSQPQISKIKRGLVGVSK